jgi:hypothetical protein
MQCFCDEGQRTGSHINKAKVSWLTRNRERKQPRGPNGTPSDCTTNKRQLPNRRRSPGGLPQHKARFTFRGTQTCGLLQNKIAEPKQTVIDKQVPAEMNTYATTEEVPFLCNGEVNISITTEELLGNCVFCWGRPDAI